jgi:large subunit ribosomal protein L30
VTTKAPGVSKTEEKSVKQTDSKVSIKAVKVATVKVVAKKEKSQDMKYLRVTQTSSGIGRKPGQQATLIGLGLGGVNKSRILEDTPSVRGMLNKVEHLVTFKAVD